MPPKPSFKKHKEDAAKGLTSGQVTQRHQTRQVESTIIAGSSTVTTKSTLPLPPQPLQQLPRVSPAIERLENAAPPTNITDKPPNVTDKLPKTRIQASKTLSDFQDAFPKLLDFMFEHHADAACGSGCRCQRPGNLIVYCPARPADPHLNMEDNWEKTPDNLRHLQQTRLTADGNHHSNKYSKNTDPDDVSLYDGNAYIPRDQEYKEYLEKLPKNPREVRGLIFKSSRIWTLSGWSAFSAVISLFGRVSISSWARNSQIQIMRMFMLFGIANLRPMSDIDLRFAKKADCLSSYDIMTWFELNQLAPQTRQMNNGHRHDTMIDHHFYWNGVKTSNMAATLYNEVSLAKTLFLEKHGIFKALCTLYADRLPTWNGMDRRSRLVRGKEVTCIYRQDEKKAPSQTRIYETLLTELSSAEAPSLQLTIPVFLNEALLIRTEQRQIIYAQSSERESMRNHLRKRIDDWRKLQRDLTPQIGDFVARQAGVSLKSADCPEKAVAEYSATRDAMISLGLSSDNPQFPELTMDDNFRKPTNVKRAIGDSRRHDGGIWVGGARPTASSSLSTQLSASEPLMAYSGTQEGDPQLLKLRPRQKRRRTTLSGKQSTGNDKESSQPREDGWIWSFKSGKEMSDADLQKWMDDGDRVQWFRAEAEMERWQEEWEAKQAEFKRCINTFRKMSDNAGKVAYAKRQSAIFGEMERRAVELFKQAGYEHLITLEDGKILADYILEERSKAEYIIPELVDAQVSMINQCQKFDKLKPKLSDTASILA
ncbi:hypothetical protein GALMADRAFT_283703 [Galerina marginata CBS 339.88]|uniref:Uncharacterized protein n=1 Tax=Galerina marginata (strain CBS 339.88) TaxID=685588 RepID=A0A067SJC0_GALM3|nr:hypothetical protein GALMADRAFT_283703 [Galerina marginata CBS 339.88]